MDDQIAEMMADYGMTAVTPDQIANRAEFAEIVDEDPRSYKRALEHQATRGPAPVRVTRGWSLASLSEKFDEIDAEDQP